MSVVETREPVRRSAAALREAERLMPVKRRPDWLRIRVPAAEQRERMFALLAGLSLHTVCEEANCPNLAECFCRGTATFMILGRHCTRNCLFCNVAHEAPGAPDATEPARVAQAVAALGLRHVVVTSVTRDDLPDGGAGHFAETVRAIRAGNPDTAVEVLIPDFQGDASALEAVLEAKPDVLAHNVETVPSLYGAVRPMAGYRQSLGVLRQAADWAAMHPSSSRLQVKSGFMLGLGETDAEVGALLADLRKAGCDRISIGQYLAPSPSHHPVVSYIPPESFARWERIAEGMGFAHVASGPLVRSSWHAEEGMPARVLRS